MYRTAYYRLLFQDRCVLVPIVMNGLSLAIIAKYDKHDFSLMVQSITTSQRKFNNRDHLSRKEKVHKLQYCVNLCYHESYECD